jgi:hypothetical protein
LCSKSGTLQRLLPDGAPDQTFGSGGVSEVLPLSVERISFDDQGRILLAGSASYGPCAKLVGSSSELAVARLQANGSLDPSFGNSGVVRTHTEGKLEDVSASGLAVREDGTILVAGQGSSSGSPSGSLIAFSPMARLIPPSATAGS